MHLLLAHCLQLFLEILLRVDLRESPALLLLNVLLVIPETLAQLLIGAYLKVNSAPRELNHHDEPSSSFISALASSISCLSCFFRFSRFCTFMYVSRKAFACSYSF